GDAGGEGVVVAVPQLAHQFGVQAGSAVGAGGPDRGAGFAQGVARLPGPDLGYRVDRVGIVKVAVQVSQALLDSGEPGVVGEVASVVVADQHPGEVIEDAEP